MLDLFVYMTHMQRNASAYPILRFKAGNFTTKATAGNRPVKTVQKVSRSKKKHLSKGGSSTLKQETKLEQQKVPSAGFIGPTNFSVGVPLFASLIKNLEFEIDIRFLIAETARRHDKLITNHGVQVGTEKWKKITLYATGLLEGREPENPGWVSTGKTDKWPKTLNHLRPLFHFVTDNSSNETKFKQVCEVRRLLLTLFKLNRVCHANSSVDLTGIKSRFKLDPEMTARFERYVRTKLSEVRESITISTISFKLFLGPSNGPNGKPKLETALPEGKVLTNSELFKPFQEICELTANSSFLKFFTNLVNDYEGDVSKIQLRKLTSIPDKGNKSRVVAICDFWTQTVLAPIETIVNRVAKQLFYNNCCFDSHTRGWNEIQNQSSEVKDQLVSLDATNWTDNMPQSLQLIVMKALFGQRLADAWYALAVKCPWYVPGQSQPIFYGKGQGMGTKGSFAIAQLTDLLFIEFSLNELYQNKYGTLYFMKVGDDLVVQDPENKLYSRYEQIGVSINLHKSKFKTKTGVYIEFVSRNMWNNLDYSIVSPTLLSHFRRDDYYLVTLFYHLKERVTDYPSLLELLKFKRKESNIKEKSNLSIMGQRAIKLLQIIDIVASIESSKELFTNSWKDVPNKEKILFIRNLILVTLGELVYSSQKLNGKRDELLSREKAEIMLTRLQLSSNDSDIWGFAIENSLSLQETVSLQESMILIETRASNLEVGARATAPTIEVFETLNQGVASVSPVFFQYLVEIQLSLANTNLGLKTLHQLSLADKANTRSILYLHRLLNHVRGLEQDALNLETGQYRIPFVKGEQYVTLNTRYIEYYVELFKFDSLLESISDGLTPEAELEMVPTAMFLEAEGDSSPLNPG